METWQLKKDIKVICITAKSFPNGVLEAHQTLQLKLQDKLKRNFFGFSRPGPNGEIIYKAAVEKLNETESIPSGCEEFIIRKGNYASIFITNFHDKIWEIGKAFQELISIPEIDPDGYCQEQYLNDIDVRCMVALAK